MPRTSHCGSIRAVAVTAGIVAVLAGCGDQIASSGKPPVLRLTDSGAARAMGVAEPASSGGDTGTAGGYTLVGTLPAGQPDPQPIYRPAPASETDAADVAAALGLTRNVTEVTGGWVVRGPHERRLAVRDDGSWTYGMDCYADQPIEKESLDVMCASAAGGGVAVPSDVTATPAPTPFPTPPPGPPTAEAEQVAGAIFGKLGIGTNDLVSYQGSPTTSVTAAATLDGKQTSGWSTRLDIDVDHEVAGGDGWLTTVVKRDDYPVITAQPAFDQLKLVPLGRPEICMVRKDGKPGCEEPPPLDVTGAVLGLALDHDGKGAVLVPAWLFTVKGQSEPTAQIAIDPAYLAPPAAPSAGPTDQPVNVATPEQVPPATPK